MKNTLSKIIPLVAILFFVLPSFAIATVNQDYNDYCVKGEEMSIDMAFKAYSKGLIIFNLSVNESKTLATFKVVNKTNCTFPVSLSSYKMFDTVLSHQEFFKGTGLVNATSSTSISVELPGCMAQIDAWYGLHPEKLLDSNPYQYPNIPTVVAYDFIKNNGSGFADASGDFCKKEILNTKPVITVTGINPVEVTLGNTYLDLGATAFDLEDGDITSKIVKTGEVNTNATGTYFIKYNVVDSKGLYAEEKTREIKVISATTTPKDTVFVTATKIVCKEESDLPNWGAGGPDISSTTATDFILAHPNCSIVPWVFEWAGKDAQNPGDNSVSGSSVWTPFGGTTTVPVAEKVWIREQFNSNYIPFVGLSNSSNISAEIYCDTDVLNYDNYEFITPDVKDKTYFCVAWNVLKTTTPPTNNPPVITIIGSSTIDIYVGDNYNDLGATAKDLEDGDITSKMVTHNYVDVNVPGTYYVVYKVVDSGGLHAEKVLRTVNVLEKPVSQKGKIKVCLVIADINNQVATSSYLLPSGEFKVDLGTTTSSLASTTIIKSHTWTASTFTPSHAIISNIKDAECISYENLPYGTYTYNQIATTSNAWEFVSYNDQDTQPVNNVFDFFKYGNTNTNSDGYIILGDNRYERTLYILAKYNNAPVCNLPTITSPLSASVNVNTQFSYTLTASSTDTLSVSTTSLPSWLSFSTTTNTLSGTPTTSGTYNVSLSAKNACGVNDKTLVITVNSVSGGGGGSPTADLSVSKTADRSTANTGDTITYTITVVNSGPNNATEVRLTDTIPSTLTFVSSTSTLGSYATSTGVWTIGNLSNNATTTLTIVATVNSGTSGQTITNTASVTSAQSDPNGANNTSSIGFNVNSAPVVSTGGGGGGGGGVPANGPISTFVPSNGPIVSASGPIVPAGCYYLLDYLRKDFNNNPVEVIKLQVFLRDLEGFKDVKVTGVYDDQTIVALNAFQDRYKDDILTPWGHKAPTSYVYILTKKKVNEIYCKVAFPVTALQQEEIDNYRDFLLGLEESGVVIPSVPTDNIEPSKPNTVVIPQVGKSTTTNEVELLGTLASYSSTTKDIISNLTANVISVGKRISDLLSESFVWPFQMLVNKTGQCADTFIGLGWLNYMLILVILILSYLWHREYKNNKSIEEINKEIDLQ